MNTELQKKKKENTFSTNKCVEDTRITEKKKNSLSAAPLKMITHNA